MLILTQKILKNCKNIETVILNTSATLSLILKTNFVAMQIIIDAVVATENCYSDDTRKLTII
jgi:hypothetical protein